MMAYLQKLDRATRALIGLGLAIVLFFSVNIFANITFKSMQLDLTEDKLFTLSEGTRKVLGSLKEPIDVRLFFSRALGDRSPDNARYYNRVRELLEQYSEISKGKVRLTFNNPESFSDEEDRAIAFGLQGIPVNEAGDPGYFGLAATNSTDDEAIVPFFATDREAFLEYDLTKFIQSLVNPTRRVVGLLSTIPMAGGYLPTFGMSERWPVIEHVLDFFEVMPLPVDSREIPKEVDILMIVHPRGLNEFTLYAIDQFVLNGGKALIFIDPVAEAEAASSRKQGFRPRGSDFNRLLDAWGLRLAPNQVAGDLDAARRVNVKQDGQMRVADYVAWLSLTGSNLDANDVVTGGLKLLNVASAGILEPVANREARITPLLKTGSRTMRIDAAKIRNGADAIALFRDFKADAGELTIAARVSGAANTAFPNGPKGKGFGAKSVGHLDKSTTPIAIIVVADVDMLHQRFWVEINNSMGRRVLVPTANNGDFVVNALDNLSGSEALVGLRGRGESTRPFKLVQSIRKVAERQFRDKEQELRQKLTDAQNRLNDLMSREKKGEVGEILRIEEKRALENSRIEMISIRRELRDVQHALRKDIERLESWMKFFNIAAIPLALGLATLVITVVTRLRRRSRMRSAVLTFSQ